MLSNVYCASIPVRAAASYVRILSLLQKWDSASHLAPPLSGARPGEGDWVNYFGFEISLLNSSCGLLVLMEYTDRSYILESCSSDLVKKVCMQM